MEPDIQAYTSVMEDDVLYLSSRRDPRRRPAAPWCQAGKMNITQERFVPRRLFLKDDRASDAITVNVIAPDAMRHSAGSDARSATGALRSRAAGAVTVPALPSAFFEGCGIVWNTFSTHGCCPGCSHQWRWTSCLRCGKSSLHKDWYAERDGRL